VTSLKRVSWWRRTQEAHGRTVLVEEFHTLVRGGAIDGSPLKSLQRTCQHKHR